MNVTHIVFDVNTFGITQRSLKMLRDALSEKLTHRIAVVEVPTNNLCCGYFIFDWEWQNATFTGDGFRTDRAGEGGAGYRSAEALFTLYRIQPIPWDSVNLEEIYTLPEKEIEKLLLELARKIADELDDREFSRPVDKNPYYIR
ncbi:MAG: hypothetical protein AB1480_03815 [Nitrospirota bacterium]